MSRQSSHQASGSRPAGHQHQQQQQQHRTSTPSRILDELLALGPEVAPANVTVLDYRNSKWRQEDALDDSFSSQFAQALGESLAANSSRQSPASSGASNTTLTPPLPPVTSSGEQQAFSFDSFQPTSVPLGALSGVKILDIRRTKTDRRRATSPVAGSAEPAPDQMQRANRGITQASASQHRPNQQQQQQRQQSGETLSSYESDYDLLVYLGETETEDIVDTERSLDYQDQTWRQSICGGASLAPTIDESLSELLSTGNVGSTQLIAGPSVTPNRLNAANFQEQPFVTDNSKADHLESLQTRTSNLNSAYNAKQLDIYAANNNQSSNWSSTLPPPSQQQQQQQQSRRVGAEKRQLSNTLNVQPSSRQATSFSLSNQVPYAQTGVKSVQEPPDGVASNKLGLGNKLVSLFNRKQLARQQTVETTDPIGHEKRATDEQQWASLSNLPTVQPPKQFAGSNLSDRHRQEIMAPSRKYAHNDDHFADGADDAAELDRLLAEMSQSLDLDSLARYDPYKGRPPQVEHQQSAKLKTVTGHAQPLRNNVTRPTNKPSQVSTTRSRAPPPEQSPYANSQSSSLLDEYDGASKILEQMITDQLEESSRPSRSTTQSTEALPSSKKSIGSQAKAASRKFSSSSAATTEVSVISNPSAKRAENSEAIERYDNLLVNQRAPIERIIKVEPERAASQIHASHSLELADKRSPPTIIPTSNSPFIVSQKAQMQPPLASKLGRQERMVKAQLQSNNHRGAPRSSTPSSLSSTSSQPPKPPAPDYHDDEGPTSIESHVIQVEAAQALSSLSSTSDDEANRSNRPQHKQMMNKMKRRTLSGMRSMRNKFNDLTSSKRDSIRVVKEEQRQHSIDSPSHEMAFQGPKPPKRSSSIGSNKSGTQSSGHVARISDVEHLEARLKSPEPADCSTRQSRGRERKREIRQQANSPGVAGNQDSKYNKSFGQQLRERLSRSKSRFRQFLSGPQLFRKRAQSTPDEKRHISIKEISAPIGSGTDLALFQPGDIARNTPIQEQSAIREAALSSSPDRPARRDRFDSSLERHLMASLEPKKASETKHETPLKSPPEVRTAVSPSSTSTSELSGLDTTGKKQVSRFELPPIARSARAARRRRQPKAADKEEVADSVDAGKAQQRRPTSLISLKRLSGSFARTQGKEQRDTAGQVEDLDSMKVSAQRTSSSQNLIGGASKSSRRRAKRRNKSNLSDRKASPDSLTNEQLAPKRATTDDYFGLVAPPKAADSPEPIKPPASVHLRIEMGPRVRPASALQGGESATLNGDNQRKLTGSSKVPHRSHSLKSIGKRGASEVHDDGGAKQKDGKSPIPLTQKAVSFHNLALTPSNQRRQLCPASPNSFRPISVTPTPPPKPTSAKDTPVRASNVSASLTPVQPTQTALIKAAESAEVDMVSSSLKAPEVRSGSKSPIRERGVALLGDIRTKYNELFKPSSKVEATSARSISPPSRPPRRHKRDPKSAEASRRARSLAAGELPRELDDDDQSDQRFIELEPSSPPTSLLQIDSRLESPSGKSKTTKQPASKRLVELASHLKSSAADFFHPPKSSNSQKAAPESTQTQAAKTAARQRPFLRNIDEPMRQDDLCHWRPIIESSRKSSAPDGSQQNSRLPKRSNSFRISKDGNAQGDISTKLKLRTSVDSDSTWESSESSHKEDRTSDRHAVVRADLTTKDESSGKLAASRAEQVAKTSSAERSPVAGPTTNDEVLRASARHGSISHANSGQQLAEVEAEAEGVKPNEELLEAEFTPRLASHSAVGGTIKTFTQQVSAADDKTKSIEKRRLESDNVGGNLIGDQNNNIQQHRHTTAEQPDGERADAASKRIAASRGKIVAHGELKSAARQIDETKAPHQEDQRASMKSDASQPVVGKLQKSVARIEPKEFKFNENLPSPSELSQDQTNKMAIEGSARAVASQRRLDDADIKFIKATSHRRHQPQTASRPSPNLKPTQEQDDDSQQNRLSIYENVSASDQAADLSSAIQTRHLMGSSLLSDTAQCEQKHQETDPNRDDEWKVELDDRLVQKLAALKPIKPQAETTAQTESQDAVITSAKTSVTVNKKPERKLVSMTSIIHEPEDDLMNVSTISTKVDKQEDDQERSNELKSRQNASDITIDELDDLLDNQENGNVAADQDDDDDSFAAAAASRKLLVNRFERKMEPNSGPRKRTPIEQPHKRSISVKQKAAAFQPPAGASSNQTSSLRPAPRPSGSSLVQRLAKNFDQTVQEQPAARGLIQAPLSRREPPLAASASPSSPSQHTGAKTGAARHPLRALASLEQDEPKSDSTWYDAKSIELLDEAEVAQLLREFDDDDDQGANVSAADRQSQATNEPYLSVGEQQGDELTLSHDDTGQRDNHAHQDDDDPTLNDDETLNEDDQTEPNVDLLDQEEEEDEESVYASVATSSQQAASKGKDQISQTNLASPAATPKSTSSTQPVERSPAAAGARDVLKAPKGLDVAAAAKVRTESAAPVGTKIASQSWQDKDLLSSVANKIDQIESRRDEEEEGLPKQEREQQASEAAESRPHSPPTPLPPTNLDFNRRFAKSDTIETVVPQSPQGQVDTNLAATSPTSTITPTKIQTHDSDTQTIEQIDNERTKQLSSMLSASLSSTDSLNNDDLKALESLNSKILERAAKKCSRFYEKLLLARQRALEQQPAGEQSETKTGSLDTTLTARDHEPHDYDLDECEQRDAATASNQQPSGNLEPGEDDDDDDEDDDDDLAAADLTSDQSSCRGDDQISLSSSSLNSESFPEIRQRQNLQKLYNIVNEICSSEEKFLATLRLLNVDFRQHIHDSLNETATHNGNTTSKQQSLQQPPFDVVGAILKHLPQLQTLNENLLAELKRARDQWPKTQKISHVLVKIGPFLKHYSGYIRDFEIVQAQYNENLRKFAQFSEVITSFERAHEEKCQKLSVQHHLLRPIQRIPQYRLLLQQYLHHLKPDDADYEDTVSALEVVSRVAEHANHSLSEGANFSKLLALQAKIVGKQRDIVQPGRLFIKEGELLKVCRKQIQPRWLVLLNDSLLYMKQIQSSDILYLKYELPLDDCQVSVPEEEREARDKADQSTEAISKSHEREFNIRTTVRSMTLVAKSQQERNEWLAALRSTIGEHVAKRRSFQQAGGNHSSPQKGLAGLPDLIGRKAPIWTPDSRVATCQLCTSNFSALFRRHHCRACGRVVCSACSGNRAPLIYLKCRAARVCDQCFDQLRDNMHLYYRFSNQIDEREMRRIDEHFKTLLKSQFVKHVISWSKSSNKPHKQHKQCHKTDKQK